MKKTVIVYGVTLAAGIIFLMSIEYYFTIRVFPLEVYITLITLSFVALGIWIGKN